MATPTKPTPVNTCLACGRLMARKRTGKRLEDLGAFKRRRYCDRACMAKGMERDVCKSASRSRMKAHAFIKTACETCGRTEKLHVHHKDHNPFNNTRENLQTLCVRCHALAHSPNYAGTPEVRKSCRLCLRPSAKNGLCFTHISRQKRFGDPCLKKIKIGSSWVLTRVDGEGAH